MEREIPPRAGSTRRAVRAAVVLGCFLFAVAGASSPASGEKPDGPTIATINTLADWFLDPGAPFANEPFEPEAVQKIIDRHKSAGVQRIAWRVTDGGTTHYHSKLRDPFSGLQPSNIHREFFMTPDRGQFERTDFRKFDSFREALTRARRAGIEVYAWMQVAGEDDGWGYASRRVREHPEVNTVGRDGVRFNAKLAWSNPSNHEYLLGLIREVLAYKPDGIILDFLKNQGDYRNQLTDRNGVALYGYEEAAVRRFRELYGKDPFSIPNDDPQWVRFRAGFVTEFARKASSLVRAEAPGTRILAQVWGGGMTTHFVRRSNPRPGEPLYETVTYPVRDALSGCLSDVATWSREGLFDAVYPLISTRDMDEYRARLRETRDLVAGGRSKFAAGAYIWGQPHRVGEFARIAAEEFGVAEIYIAESVPLEPGGWAFLRSAIESLSGPAPPARSAGPP